MCHIASWLKQKRHLIQVFNKYFFKIDENEHKILKNKNDFPKQYLDAIPLGTIEFTQNYFKIFYREFVVRWKQTKLK